ncbi:MAG: aminoacyl-tRNA hydrolase [Candidatus Moranbacteria bacterium]|nr:aminoacyl-tRNA hydrolase [Candidatus Moranbacteria bacterium]
MTKKLIIGLGNPGEKYAKTRHNIGFMILDLLAEEYSANFKFDKNSNSEVSEIIDKGEKILLCKPQTFMNNSGQAVQALTSYYKVEPQAIKIIHDEIDLPFADIRLSENSSSAGHKGVQSIIDHLGTQEFKRLRFGIQREDNDSATEMFVLKNFSKEELDGIEKIDIKSMLYLISK